MHEMQTGRQNASVEELVAAGYLKPEFLTRQKVQREEPRAVPPSSQ